jgi:hypothetical protein
MESWGGATTLDLMTLSRMTLSKTGKIATVTIMFFTYLFIYAI